MSVELKTRPSEVLSSFATADRVVFEAARDMIYEICSELDNVGDIEESLKWGQPSYGTKPKTGTPIRLGLSKGGSPALFVHCQTTLVSDLDSNNIHGLETLDNRAVLLPKGTFWENPGLRSFVRAALTYHL